MLIAFLFPVLVLSIIFQNSKHILKKCSYSRISKKHEQTYISFTNVFDILG